MNSIINKEEDFLNFYKNVLSTFLYEKKLKLNYRAGTIYVEASYNSTPGMIAIHLSKHDIDKINFGYYGSDFLEKAFSMANEKEKLAIVKNEFQLFDYKDLITRSYNNPEYMKIIFGNINKSVLKSYKWQSVINELKKVCSPQLYDELIDIFLSDKLSDLKVKKNKIIMNLMLDYVSNNEIYHKYNSLIPDNDISTDIFDTLGLDSFELNVAKNKLYSLIVLPNRDKYNKMHEKLIEKLNEETAKEKFEIFAVEGEVKFKSSKYYRYIFRVKENSAINMENAKMLVMSFYKLYRDKINNIPEDKREHEVLKEIDAKEIELYYLNHKLSKKTTMQPAMKEKKNKI